MTQTTLREYLRTTEDAISSGRIDEAMASCQNILAYFPEALEAQHLLGEVYLAQGQLEEAQQTFEWILTNDPENVIVYCDRALISERTSDIDTALDCYQQAYELSRGNANIRQEFNQLSARAGQQEFMFSRAGLARLYMRGNLLTQAIQEWEAVLAISPERLDARLGLVETYWRESLFDKAEQLASQMLDEIPTCLKALLYLAHIVSISNITRARDLLLRAETLDPELRMAQEVFVDLAASQPNDPFLLLIQKEPILLEDGVPVNRPIPSLPAAPVEQSAPIQAIPPA
ncbi:MAG: tetratricopeptide repeat protein, partial [Ktedonobacteraceae bacterium]